MAPTAGECTMTLQGHTDSVWCVACVTLSDGTSRRAISGSTDKTLRVWDLPAEEQGAMASPSAATANATAQLVRATAGSDAAELQHALHEASAAGGVAEDVLLAAVAQLSLLEGGGASGDGGGPGGNGGGEANHLATDATEALTISIMPDTPWERIQPSQPFLEELASNAGIASACPEILRIVRETRLKVQEVQYDDDAGMLSTHTHHRCPAPSLPLVFALSSFSPLLHPNRHPLSLPPLHRAPRAGNR